MNVTDVSVQIAKLLPEPHAGLLSGIVFGARSELSSALYDDLITTGTLHIVALSGMNITMLTAFAGVTLRMIFSKRWSSLLSILFTIGFILFVGPSPTIVRAGIMGSIVLLAVIFGRQTWSLWIWTITVILMIIVKPDWIGNISFQLSSMATLGLILFGPSGKEKLKPTFITGSQIKLMQVSKAVFRPLWYVLKADLHVTLAAQVFTVPIILFYFHRISLISPVTNMLIGWVIAPVTVIGFLIAVISFIFFPLAKILSLFAWMLLEYIILIITIFAQLPLASIGY